MDNASSDGPEILSWGRCVVEQLCQVLSLLEDGQPPSLCAEQGADGQLLGFLVYPGVSSDMTETAYNSRGFWVREEESRFIRLCAVWICPSLFYFPYNLYFSVWSRIWWMTHVWEFLINGIALCLADVINTEIIFFSFVSDHCRNSLYKTFSLLPSPCFSL